MKCSCFSACFLFLCSPSHWFSWGMYFCKATNGLDFTHGNCGWTFVLTIVKVVVIAVLATFFPTAVLIWLAIFTSEAFLFNCLHDFISSLFILNYRWRYKVQKPRWTRKVMLKFQSVLSHETNSLFQRSLYHFPASKLSLPFFYLSSSLFCSLRKITSKNLPLESCFGEIKFCWESAEIWLPYHLGSIYAKWLALRANFNLKKIWKPFNSIWKTLKYNQHLVAFQCDGLKTTK